MQTEQEAAALLTDESSAFVLRPPTAASALSTSSKGAPATIQQQLPASGQPTTCQHSQSSICEAAKSCDQSSNRSQSSIVPQAAHESCAENHTPASAYDVQQQQAHSASAHDVQQQQAHSASGNTEGSEAQTAAIVSQDRPVHAADAQGHAGGSESRHIHQASGQQPGMSMHDIFRALICINTKS